MASAKANTVDIGVHTAQPGRLLQGKGLIGCSSSYPVENGGRTCVDTGSHDVGPIVYKLKELTECGLSYLDDPDVCPLQSFLDSFEPLYWADRSPDQQSEKALEISAASGQPTEAQQLECPSDKNDGNVCGDAVKVVLSLTEEPTLASFLLTPYADHAPGSLINSSTRRIDDLLLEFSDSDHELTSTFNPLLDTFDTPASQLFFPWETSKENLVHSSRANEDTGRKKIEFQAQVTPGHVSSTRRAEDSIHRGPEQSGRNDQDDSGKENKFQFQVTPAHVSSTRNDQESIRPGPQQSGRNDEADSGKENEFHCQVTPAHVSSTWTSAQDSIHSVPQQSCRKDEDARGKEHEFQFQAPRSHVSSTWSLHDSYHSVPPQSPGCKQSARDSQGKQKALEDGWDESMNLCSQQSRKRLRHGSNRLVPLTVASPVLESRLRDPSRQRGLEEFKRHGLVDITGELAPVARCRYETQCERAARRAEGYHRMRMRTLPEKSIVKAQETLGRHLTLVHRWHFRLGLDNANCPAAASRIFNRALRNFETSGWPIPIREYRLRVRVLLAAALWVAAKAMEDSSRVPGALQLAEAADVDARSLRHAELPLLDTLGWKLMSYH